MRVWKWIAVVFLAAAVPAAVSAKDIQKGDLVISGPWSRATPAGSEVGAGYLTITNRGTSAERLISFTTDVAGQPEVHEMSTEGGTMKMRPLTAGLTIPPGGTVKLAPGGYHLMLLKLKKPLVAGQSFKATLVFEKAGPVEVEFEVRALGAGQQKSQPGHHNH